MLCAAALWALGVSPWWSVLLLPVPALVVYVRLANDRAGGITETEKLRLAWNYRYSQPREILGLNENTEPTDFDLDASAILVDPSGMNLGSATVQLYDVPPDAVAAAAPGGSPVTVSAGSVPGQA